jgi:hypothetical protein
VLIVMALLPLLLRAPWRDRLAWVAAFFLPAVVVAQSWKLYAHLRFGDAVAQAEHWLEGAVESLEPARALWLTSSSRSSADTSASVTPLVLAATLAARWPGGEPNAARFPRPGLLPKLTRVGRVA